MRIGMWSLVICTVLLLAPAGAARAQDAARNHPARGFDRQPFDETRAVASDGPETGTPAGEEVPPVSVTAPRERRRAVAAAANLPPVLVGHAAGETIMVATDQGGSPVSVMTVAPGLADPLHPAQQFETTIDLGLGVNARLVWNTDGAFAFAFGP